MGVLYGVLWGCYMGMINGVLYGGAIWGCYMGVLYVEYVKCQYANLCSLCVNMFTEFVPSSL
jgi:hypothetical protein